MNSNHVLVPLVRSMLKQFQIQADSGADLSPLPPPPPAAAATAAKAGVQYQQQQAGRTDASSNVDTSGESQDYVSGDDDAGR